MQEDKKEYTYAYPHPAVATDCVVFGFDGKELKVLLIERGGEPCKGMWAFPGGFLNMDETVEECARRELEEETALKLSFLKQMKVFSEVNRDPRERVISVAFYALVRKSEVKGGDDAVKAEWFPIDNVPLLAFDHDRIFREAMQRIKKDIHFEPIGFELLDDEFTMPQLQRLYESILGVSFDRRNFQKKMLQLGLLEPADEEGEDTVFPDRCSLMVKKPISELFGGSSAYASHHEASVANGEGDEYRHTGRKGRKYRFNKDKYDRLKKDDSFKLEF